MPRPFYVDHWYLWSDGTLRQHRYDCASIEDADRRMMRLAEIPETTRIAIGRRGKGRSTATLRVWEGNMAGNGPVQTAKAGETPSPAHAASAAFEHPYPEGHQPGATQKVLF